MSMENRPSVDRILTTVESGLRDFVLCRYREKFGGQREYLNELNRASDYKSDFESESDLKGKLESPGWLKSIHHRPNLFRFKFGNNVKIKDPDAKKGFKDIDDLLIARNRFAHWNDLNGFTDSEVYDLANSATRLLSVIEADDEAAITGEIRQRYLKKLNGASAEDTVVETERAATEPAYGNDSDGISAEAPDSDAKMPSTNQVDLTDAKLPKLDWRGRNIRQAKLHNTDLSQGIFSEEDLSHMTLEQVNLWHARLQNANLRGSKLQKVDLRKATLQGATFCDSNFTNVDLRRADLTDADLQGAKIAQPKMSNVLLTGAKLQGVTIESARFSYWKLGQLRTTIALSGLNMTRARFAKVDLSGVNMSKANLTDACFLHEDIEWLAEFGAWKKLAFSEETYQPKPSCLYRVNLKESDLTRAIAAKVDLKESNLEKSTLANAILQGTKLNDANLREATLFKTNLILADLSGADLRGADLTDAKMHGAKLESAKLGLATKLPDGSYWHEEVEMAKFTAWPPPAPLATPPR